ncbi:glycosyltransferase family 2 protein [Quadrisphaera sp. DSM 44207]|uniref:glycosyltransferase family 2 protein n=1 Tax=Quadrisphaera sp. DSM 44207 TaxID=1881057 RepID=UPI000889ACF5|nr:glycosyltransferase [Quadrisphaera sp. DSM 44207]SDQ68860.1 Glycosyltransferase, catalytic subunit of cellulose synthase and poly-beta-1,6-N-acetylglucosamine synthase [Quadrisphaera sp. DSM 44207]
MSDLGALARSGPLDEALAWFFAVSAWPVLVYFLLINTSYLVLVALAALDHARHLRRVPFAGYDEVHASPLTTPVSVLVPAHDEEAGIVPAVGAMLALRYPVHEVVVVDDGSRDATFERLAEAYGLVQVPRELPQDVATRGRVLSVHVPRDGRTPLVVVRKENGGRSDALNVAVNAARHELVCFVDADSILDPDALLTVTKPFVDDPARVVATGGVVRAVNGCRVVAGRVVEVRMPRGWLPRVQVVEYLRAFLLGRTGWSRLGSLVLISGAFGLFRRDVVVEVGGLDPDCIGEDFELCVKVHRAMRDARRDYRVVFVGEPVSWTEVPSTRRVLASQRRRWHRGLWEVLWRHRDMVGNPRYGRVGLLALPYYVVFELLAPVLELVGLLVVPLGWALGLVDPAYALLFGLVAYGYAVVVSMTALAVEEFSFHRYGRWRDLGTAVLVAVLENLGYRQLTAWWRLQGLWAALRGREQVWGVMTRVGFADEAPATPALAGRAAGAGR